MEYAEKCYHWLIKHLVYKMSKDFEKKCSAPVMRALRDVFNLLPLSNRQSRTQRLFVYYHPWRKNKNSKSSHWRSWRQNIFEVFAWKKTETINPLSKQLATNFLLIVLPFSRGWIVYDCCIHSVSYLPNLYLGED